MIYNVNKRLGVITNETNLLCFLFTKSYPYEYIKNIYHAHKFRKRVVNCLVLRQICIITSDLE